MLNALLHPLSCWFLSIPYMLLLVLFVYFLRREKFFSRIIALAFYFPGFLPANDALRHRKIPTQRDINFGQWSLFNPRGRQMKSY